VSNEFRIVKYVKKNRIKNSAENATMKNKTKWLSNYLDESSFGLQRTSDILNELHGINISTQM